MRGVVVAGSRCPVSIPADDFAHVFNIRVHVLTHAVPDTSSRCPPDVYVGAVLGDALRCVAVLGGREGMPRSLGSVYGGSVTRFLGGSLRGVMSRVIDTPGLKSVSNGVAVSRDGCLQAVLVPSTSSMPSSGLGVGSSVAAEMGRRSSRVHAKYTLPQPA